VTGSSLRSIDARTRAKIICQALTYVCEQIRCAVDALDQFGIREYRAAAVHIYIGTVLSAVPWMINVDTAKLVKMKVDISVVTKCFVAAIRHV